MMAGSSLSRMRCSLTKNSGVWLFLPVPPEEPPPLLPEPEPPAALLLAAAATADEPDSAGAAAGAFLAALATGAALEALVGPWDGAVGAGVSLRLPAAGVTTSSAAPAEAAALGRRLGSRPRRTMACGGTEGF
jgi:hypothetical protein